jgi:hypothetical protein
LESPLHGWRAILRKPGAERKITFSPGIPAAHEQIGGRFRQIMSSVTLLLK